MIHGVEMPNMPTSAEDFSLDQFKQNNARLQAILMQLQTPQFNEQQLTSKASRESQSLQNQGANS
jgi:hypothetical protein